MAHPHLYRSQSTNLNGTKFKRYLAIFKAYPQKDVGNIEKLIINLTMSKKVRFFLFATPFCCGVPRAINWDIIPCSLRKESNSLDMYSPPRLD